MKERQRILAVEAVPLAEAFNSATGTIPITVIKAGFNKSKQRYYPAATLKRDYKIFEGARMYADHQTEKEAKERPEGSVHNWVGTLKKVWAEEDGTIKAHAAVIDPAFRAKLEMLNTQKMINDMGVSIRAIGEASTQEVEGLKTTYIESLLAARSVDFVTHAGAGGRVEALEAAVAEDNDVDVITEAKLRVRRPDLVDLIESKLRGGDVPEITDKQIAEFKEVTTKLANAETALATLTKELEEANKKISDSEKVASRAKVAVELEKMLGESKLPKVSQERIKKHFAEAEKVDGMKEAISDEQAYLKTLNVVVKHSGVRDNGKKEDEVEEGDRKEFKVSDLEEAFMPLGLTKEEAKIAASGKR